jgi:type IV pilus assembly protein PilE
MYKKSIRLQRGFTLIELMIVVSIIAALSALAFPSYDEYLRRGRRAEAQSQLMQAAQFLERFYTTNGKYTAAVLPTALTTSPPGSANPEYNVTVSNLAAGTYTVTATGATGTPMAADQCGAFVVDQTGARSLVGATYGVDKCWRR